MEKILEPIVKPKIGEGVVYTEDLDLLLEEAILSFKVTWTSKDNKEWNLVDIEDDHLINLNKWLKRNKLLRTQEIIWLELERRANENQAWSFEFYSKCMEYKENPEIWRLKIYL